ncbi:hypothetical protein HMPREF0349_0041 [Enterococcus faecalis TX1322]|nr:hypothetical protein HMPREF0349_0041 [Enterococcus faecalis TX1322]EFT42737.1 hypothetical protein HMPREF9496_00264 [Enterococcus faecalis TX4000]
MFHFSLLSFFSCLPTCFVKNIEESHAYELFNLSSLVKVTVSVYC